MTVVPVPDSDRIVRYVKPSLIEEDKIANAFLLRSGPPGEKGLSVNWLEAFGPDMDHQLREVRRLSRLKLNRNGRFAELNVGTVLHKVSEELDSIQIVQDPLDADQAFEADPSHAQITGLPPGDTHHAELVADVIAAECVIALHPAVVEDGPGQ